MDRRVCAVLLSCVLLASCGGGGGGTGAADGSGASGTPSGGFGASPDEALSFGIAYPGSIPLFHQATVQPSLAGFNGRAPQCSLASGTLPPGMTLRSDCSLAGRPSQAGNHVFVLRVGASGASNTAERVQSMMVEGPSVYYTDRSFLQTLWVGQSVSDHPQLSNWTPPADVQLSWSYRLVSGALPSGVQLNERTGEISGTARERGSFAPVLQARLTTPYGTYEPVVTTYHLNVQVPTVYYGQSISSGGTVAYAGQQFALPPTVSFFLPGDTISNVTFSPALPPGLSVHPTTGVLSGVPAALSRNSHEVAATLTSGGLAVQTGGRLELSVLSPVSFAYGEGQQSARMGVPYLLSPSIRQISPVPLSGSASWTYTVSSGSSLPPGLSLDANTGTISGTPTEGGAFNPFIQASVTDNGVTWVVGTQFRVQVD